MNADATIPVDLSDPINARILAVSEDRLQGFSPDPIGRIGEMAGLDAETVIERIVAMLRAGTIRRVRQTLLATNLARGALVAWQVPEERLSAAFDWMFANDPFSGHVVIRSTDAAISAARYRLWTTIKVPPPHTLEDHCRLVQELTGATAFKIMPAKNLFALGVGHMRRRGMPIGSKADVPAEVLDTTIVDLTPQQWQVLMALKREFAPEEISRDIWIGRAGEAGVSLQKFLEVATDLNRLGVVGRFSTFLEHVKPLKTGERVTRFNALFHWAVPVGREIEVGREVGRFHIMTHAYWREAGPEFGNVNIMGVAHGTEKDVVMAHKRAIDEHLASMDIAVGYTNVFWGGRSEIKPSEISPFAYDAWLKQWKS